MQTIEQLLAEAPVFNGMSQDQLALIAGCANNSAFEEGIGVNTLISADAGRPNSGAVFHDTAVWLRRAN